jgi:hypothetical protein
MKNIEKRQMQSMRQQAKVLLPLTSLNAKNNAAPMNSNTNRTIQGF